MKYMMTKLLNTNSKISVKSKQVEQNECGNNISSTILWTIMAFVGGLTGKLSKFASAKPLWFETAFSMPMSSNTYVQINMTQKVGKNDENGVWLAL